MKPLWIGVGVGIVLNLLEAHVMTLQTWALVAAITFGAFVPLAAVGFRLRLDRDGEITEQPPTMLIAAMVVIALLWPVSLPWVALQSIRKGRSRS